MKQKKFISAFTRKIKEKTHYLLLCSSYEVGYFIHQTDQLYYHCGQYIYNYLLNIPFHKAFHYPLEELYHKLLG